MGSCKGFQRQFDWLILFLQKLNFFLVLWHFFLYNLSYVYGLLVAGWCSPVVCDDTCVKTDWTNFTIDAFCSHHLITK